MDFEYKEERKEERKIDLLTGFNESGQSNIYYSTLLNNNEINILIDRLQIVHI